MIRLAILYRLEECGERLGLVSTGQDHAFIEPELQAMFNHELIAFKGDRWNATDAGRAFLGKVVAMYDQVTKFNIFAAIELSRGLESYECLDDDPTQAVDNIYDPRFLPFGQKSETSEDMRTAMIVYRAEKLSQQLGGQAMDPYRAVFLQMLVSGRLQSDHFWFDLQVTTFPEVESIVASQYAWRDIATDEHGTVDEPEAMRRMDALYKAGLIEQQKRDGDECAGCGMPLATFQAAAKSAGQPFECCPNPECATSFVRAAPVGAPYSCPRCDAGVYSGDSVCHGCGACIDFSMPAGSVDARRTATTTTESVPVWRNYRSYSYVPYGYYNAYDPYYAADILAFAILVDPYPWW
jgi:hypothetical protein